MQLVHRQRWALSRWLLRRSEPSLRQVEEWHVQTESARHSDMANLSFVLPAAIAAVLTTSLPQRRAVAQSSETATASMRVPAVAQIRGVSVPIAQPAAPGRLQLLHTVTTASNVDYQMVAVGLEGLSELEHTGITVSVKTATGAFVALREGLAVVAAQGRRGAESVTELVVRIEGVPPASQDAIRSQLSVRLGLRATVESSSGSIVLSQAKLPAAER